MRTSERFFENFYCFEKALEFIGNRTLIGLIGLITPDFKVKIAHLTTDRLVH